MIRYLDSHCHITCERLYPRVEEILENCRTNQVDRLLVICCTYEELQRALDLKQRHPHLQIAYGFYPCDTYALNEADYTRLEDVCRSGCIDVIGEIGLDYHYADTDKDVQKEAFRRQLQLAADCHLPVSIHMRDATQDGMEILRACAKTPFVLHCFSGSVETALQAVRMGGYISFAGPLTFKNARALPQVAQAVPADRLLTETDSPYLTPVPFRGKENEPMYVRYTFEKLCALREEDPQTLSEQIMKNYDCFLKQPLK